MLPFQSEKGNPGNYFLNPFTVCSLGQQKFVFCPFVDKGTNRSYLFANGLNGLADLCSPVRQHSS